MSHRVDVTQVLQNAAATMDAVAGVVEMVAKGADDESVDYYMDRLARLGRRRAAAKSAPRGVGVSASGRAKRPAAGGRPIEVPARQGVL